MSYPFLVNLVVGITALAEALADGQPSFLWVGSNGGVGSQHGDEGVRADLHKTARGGVWVADNFYYVAGLDLDWDPTGATSYREALGAYDFALGLVSASGVLETQLIVQDAEWETIDDLIDTGDKVVYCGDFGPINGGSYSLDFNPFEGLDFHTANTNRWTGDAFLTALSRRNGELSYDWTVTFGNEFNEVADYVDAGTEGIWIAGHFDGPADFDPGPGEEWRASNGYSDVFVLKLNGNGDFQWINAVGGTGDDEPQDFNADANANTYVLGEYAETVDFNPGSGQDYHTASRGLDVFVSKYDSDGGYLWTRSLDPNLTPTGYGLSLHETDQVLIDGFFGETMDVDPGPSELLLTARGDMNGLLSMWTPNGEHVWSRQIGGPGSAAVADATFDSEGHILAVGWFTDEVDFNDAGPPDIHVSNGGLDAFLMRFTPDGQYEWTVTWGGAGEEDFADHVAAHENGDISVSGYFQGTADFDPGDGVAELTAVGNRDMFLLRFTCPSECPELLKHRAVGGVGIVKSKLVTTLPGGRATVECTGDPGTFSRSKRLDAEGRGKIKLRNLPPGSYTCAVTQLEDSAGATACEGEFQPRDVTVE